MNKKIQVIRLEDAMEITINLLRDYEYGYRVAQMLIVPYAKVQLERVEDASELSETARGTGGFGSTGR